MSGNGDVTAYARLADALIEEATKDQLADVARLLALNIGYYHEKKRRRVAGNPTQDGQVRDAERGNSTDAPACDAEPRLGPWRDHRRFRGRHLRRGPSLSLERARCCLRSSGFGQLQTLSMP